ncbi:MAG: type II toxin-antitoxin system death-on-curing family toxin [Proteobacteria bacterium]|nr:type II toxin-antitoxin system death-on-curing family toxin [Pseudomonadota bacterium]
MKLKLTLFPTLDEALELHRALLERFGGLAGVRDLGLLQSALARPQTGYYETLWLQAAALMQSLGRNHPFVDGNKRVAFALTAIFLRLNGQRIVVAAAAGETFLIDEVITGRAELADIAAWLEHHARSVQP